MSEIDWKNLVFGYLPTDYNVRCSYSDGKWGELRVHSEATMNIHISAAVLHYAQECFEGLKAFRGKDGKVRIFRMRENAKRMQSSCEGIKMPKLPIETFEAAVLKAVELNAKFVPPYESGASLYIRPVLFGTTPLVGVRPAKDYEFVVFVTPVGPYFKGGFQTTPFMLSRKYDRAAPLGTGHIKVGGNYAAGLMASEAAHDLGYSAPFYLDSKEKKYIDECSVQIAEKQFGMTVERRQIPVEELSTFEEEGACGTAAVISPIDKIVDIDNNITYQISKDGKPGEKSTKLYNYLRGIQYGEHPDVFGWTTIVEGI